MLQQNLTTAQIRRWYKRGGARLDDHTRIDKIIGRLLTIEAYLKEHFEVDLMRLEQMRVNREQVISLDSSDGVDD